MQQLGDDLEGHQSVIHTEAAVGVLWSKAAGGREVCGYCGAGGMCPELKPLGFGTMGPASC